MKTFFARLPLFILLATYLVCAFIVHTRQIKADSPGVVTLRIGHWQLESGFRQGLDYAIQEYERRHPNVRIVQEAVPESTWKQWVSTQLMGGTASDILEIGDMEPNLVTSFYVRYFLPLTSAVGHPNPYNAGTALEGIPVIKTFKDGMRSSYIPETQEFMNFPLSLIGVRVFYNRTLFQKLTGQADPPTNYREFLKVCDQIRAQTIPSGPGRGDPYVPIAGSAWHFGRWNEMMFMPITSSAVIDNDLNRDGRLSKEEMYIGYKLGRLSLKDPAYQAMLGLTQEVTHYFQVGYTGLTRDEALFLFAQERAVFIPTGSYEAMSLKAQAAGKFEVGVMNFPYPGPDDPEFGSEVEGPRYESVDGAAQFGITRNSKHAEEALDFLLFMTSLEQNEKINAKFGWIPIIQGAQVDPTLKAFEPNLIGVSQAFAPTLGPETTIRWQQLLSLFQVNQITSDQLANQFDEFYRKVGPAELEESFRNSRRAYAGDTQLLIAQREKSWGQPEGSADSIRYRKILFDRLINPELGARNLESIVNGAASTSPKFPYRYGKEALENIQRNLQTTGSGVRP